MGRRPVITQIVGNSNWATDQAYPPGTAAAALTLLAIAAVIAAAVLRPASARTPDGVAIIATVGSRVSFYRLGTEP